MDGYAWAYVATQKGSEEGEELMELIWLHFTSDLKQRNAILAAKSLYAEVERKNHLIHCATCLGCVIDCSFQTVDQLVFLFFTPQRVQALVFLRTDCQQALKPTDYIEVMMPFSSIS